MDWLDLKSLINLVSHIPQTEAYSIYAIIHTSISEAAVTRSGDLTTTHASRLSYVRAEESEKDKDSHSSEKCDSSNFSVFTMWFYSSILLNHHHPWSIQWQQSTEMSVQRDIPSNRRLPMCRMAASSLEISQFSVSVNIRTFMADRMLE